MVVGNVVLHAAYTHCTILRGNGLTKIESGLYIKMAISQQYGSEIIKPDSVNNINKITT